MILEKLTLHNFRAYAGKHELEFARPSKSKPITLIGALNGAGKTTILDALHLTLYGKLAACVDGQEKGGYDEFLRRSIHRGVNPRDGAALELQFRHERAGRSHRYVIRRSWYIRGSGARETVSVELDGELNQGLSTEWMSFAESILPSGLAPLFLFDGEKIEQLADPSRSSEMLRSAIFGLLGLDIVDQLSADLLVVERAQNKKTKGNKLVTELEEHRSKRTEAEVRRGKMTENRGEAASRCDSLKAKVRRIEKRYANEGGELFDARKDSEKQLSELRAEHDALERELLGLAEGSLPLALVPELCESVLTQGGAEELATRAQLLSSTLEERDTSLLEMLSSSRSSEAVRRDVSKFLEADRESRSRSAQSEQYLLMPPAATSRLGSLFSHDLAESIRRTRDLIARLDKLALNAEEVESRLKRAPDEEAIRDLSVELTDTRVELRAAELGLEARDRDLEEAERSVQHLNLRVEAAEKRASKELADQSASQRISAYSIKSRSTLDAFRQALLGRNCNRIEELVLASFQKLHRKRGFIKSLKVDPKTFDVTIESKGGEALDPVELSAGERQLLATAFLWGMARASGRELPTVIDTPLGRLDSEHRAHLTERYFPNASRQVVLLSTDEEIYGQHYERLEKHIGKEYRIDFDQDTGASAFVPGYFK